ncbi:MAG: hypothetical protein ACD_79C01198G0001 [uncultured bacterium]|nr:MAG: hypothetical protein ACD_79C01198G0001 [uncultured bacterium]
MKIHECPFCKETVKVKKVECLKCGISFEGEFYTSPIVSLSEEQQSFIELFILTSGSLKEMAEIFGVTYPTLRGRLDLIINDLKSQMNKREDYKKEILEKVEQGKIVPEKGAEIIKSL